MLSFRNSPLFVPCLATSSFVCSYLNLLLLLHFYFPLYFPRFPLCTCSLLSYAMSSLSLSPAFFPTQYLFAPNSFLVSLLLFVFSFLGVPHPLLLTPFLHLSPLSLSLLLFPSTFSSFFSPFLALSFLSLTLSTYLSLSSFSPLLFIPSFRQSLLFNLSSQHSRTCSLHSPPLLPPVFPSPAPLPNHPRGPGWVINQREERKG